MQIVRSWHLYLACTLLGGIGVACEGGPTPDGGVDAGPETLDVAIQFAAKVGDEDFACSDANGPRVYNGLGTSNAAVSFKDFRFYVSNVRLKNTAGALVPVTLNSSVWQHEDVALLDFEDGTAECVDVGNSELNSEVAGTVPVDDYDGVVFDLAIPFDKNHLDASASDTPSPLNLMSMAWNWQGGHKFARIDLNVQGSGGWNVHIGSTGCMSDGPTSAPTTECSKPNKSTISLDGFDPTSDTIVFDAAALLSGSDLAVNNGGPPGCQSFPTDADDCPTIFENLGLSFDTGACAGDCAAQATFHVQP